MVQNWLGFLSFFDWIPDSTFRYTLININRRSTLIILLIEIGFQAVHNANFTLYLLSPTVMIVIIRATTIIQNM